MQPKYAFILSLLITGLIASNVFLFSIKQEEKVLVTVKRVINGDTFETKDGQTIRLENINAPEKNIQGYEQAKSFLQTFENQTIEIKTSGTDKYGRTLARAFVPQYLNLEIVKNGLAVKYLVEEPEIKLFAEAENRAIQNEKGIWKKSPHFSCLSINIDSREEIVRIFNNCPEINFQDFILKNESRKKYKFPTLLIGEINLHTNDGTDNETDIFWNSKQEIWNNDRDTIYIFDKDWNLVHYHSYGY